MARRPLIVGLGTEVAVADPAMRQSAFKTRVNALLLRSDREANL